MQEFRSSLLQIASSDDDIRRRGRNLLILCFGLSVAAVVFIVIALFQQQFQMWHIRQTGLHLWAIGARVCSVSCSMRMSYDLPTHL
jgi:hypothetical protein